MSKYTAADCSIEGKSLSLSSRKFNVRSPQKADGITVHGFKLGVESSATVLEALDGTVAITRSSSSLTVGDSLDAETIEGYSLKPITPQLVQRTGGHKGMIAKTRKYAFAQIVVPFRALLESKRLAGA